MITKKHIGIIVFCVIFIVLVTFSWRIFREKPIQPQIPPTPVSAEQLDVTASVDILEDSITSDSLIELKFSWQVGPNWVTPGGSTLVFVHLQDEENVKICQDDHEPPVPINDWEAGKTYEYKRIIYIPITLLKKKMYILTGLYDRKNFNRHFAIKGLREFNEFYRYLGQEFTLLPSRIEYSESLIKYKNGWYGPELDKQGNIMRRWMQKKGEAELVNPKTDAFLYIDAWIPTSKFVEPVAITITINGHKLDIPPIEQDKLQHIFQIPSDILGDEEFIPLEIESNQSFIPADKGESTDDRELGILVKKILFRGNGNKQKDIAKIPKISSE